MNGAVAQVVEQRTENPRVGGSTPPSPTNGCPLRRETLHYASTENDINVIPQVRILLHPLDKLSYLRGILIIRATSNN